MKCAIVYDFDGTLAEGNCPEHGLMEAIGISDIDAFWEEVHELNKLRDGNEILTYLGLLALKAKQSEKKVELSPQRLRHHGGNIPLFLGVKDWFPAINKFASEHRIELYHYIISSGLEDMILGTDIAPEFKRIFGCRYHYDQDTGEAKWATVAIDYTTKTQYLFRINKGIENSWDNKAINKYIEPDKRIFPFNRMIYLGDGDTDIPAMKLVKLQGGCSLAVFNPNEWDKEVTQNKIEKLISEDRVSYVVPGDYTRGSQLDVTIRGVLRLYARRKG